MPDNTLPATATYHHSLIQGRTPSGTGNLDGVNPLHDPLFVLSVDCGSDGCSDNALTTEIDESANDNYGDLRLQPNSPAIDAGDNAADINGPLAGTETIADIATDIAGQPRIGASKSLPAKVDIGAYETGVTAPTAHTSGPHSTSEGSSIALDASASADDGVIAGYAWDCTNDGTVDVVLSVPTGGQCTYPNDGSYTLRLTVTDNLSATSSTTTTVTVANIAPNITPAVSQSTFAGNAKLFSLGTFADPGAEGTWSVTIDWGDNSTPSQFTVPTAGSLPSTNHTYALAGTFNVLFTVSDGKESDSDGFQVVVNALPAGAPAVSAAENQTAIAGAEKSFSLGSFADPSSSGPWQVSVTWGDGSPSTHFSAVTAGELAAQSHTYAASGTYDLLVSVNDGGLTGSASFQVVVSSDATNGSVTGIVFEDANGNNTQDEGEAGVAGATVTAETITAVEVANIALTGTSTTDSDGRYRFDNLPPGQYQLTFAPPTGYQGASPDTVVTVQSGQITNAPSSPMQRQGSTLYLPVTRGP